MKPGPNEIGNGFLPAEENAAPAAPRPVSEGEGNAVPAESLLSSILEGEARPRAPEARAALPLFGVVIGTLAGLDDAGQPLVRCPAPAAGPLFGARSTVRLTKSEIGRDVALMFENGDPARPIVIGVILHPEGASPAPVSPAVPVPVQADSERVVLTADKEIVLRCGEASITLTRAGKVLIRGAYLLSRSSGVNRIKGGSVQIN
jgi:hypothetical protein